jgi:hypothetical protein
VTAGQGGPGRASGRPAEAPQETAGAAQRVPSRCPCGQGIEQWDTLCSSKIQVLEKRHGRIGFRSWQRPLIKQEVKMHSKNMIGMDITVEMWALMQKLHVGHVTTSLGCLMSFD